MFIFFISSKQCYPFCFSFHRSQQGNWQNRIILVAMKVIQGYAKCFVICRIKVFLIPFISSIYPYWRFIFVLILTRTKLPQVYQFLDTCYNFLPKLNKWVNFSFLDFSVSVVLLNYFSFTWVQTGLILAFLCLEMTYLDQREIQLKQLYSKTILTWNWWQT